MKFFRIVVLAAVAFAMCAPARAQWQTPNHSVPVGRGPGVTGFSFAAPGAIGTVFVSNGATLDPTFQPLSPAFVLPTPTRAGDFVYWNGSIWTNQPGNNSAVQFLTENGTGVPAWLACGSGFMRGGSPPVCSPMTGADLPNPSASTLGGVQSLGAVSHQWINSISTAGVPAASQPAVGDISGIGAGVPAALGNALSAAGGVSSTIASGASAMGTGVISSGTCATAVTTSAPGIATTDAIAATFNGDPTAVTGYIPSTNGMLTIIAYPTANNVNFKVCNNTSASVTPGAVTINWRVVR